MLRGRAMVALVCMLAATVLSGVLLLEHHGIAGPVAAAVCGDASGAPPAGLATGSTPGASRPTGCEEVARSPYSAVQGIPLAAFGLAFSAALCGLLALAFAVSEDARRGLLAAALLALGLALVVDVMLFGVQVFAIGRFCALCLATYVTNGLAFAALLPARTGATSVTTALAAPEGRVALAGVAVAATLALGLTALTDRGLAAAASNREAALLGTAGRVAPSPAATTPGSTTAVMPGAPEAAAAAATPAAAPGSDLAAAQAEVTRLRGILADPQKLQDYLEQQARDEFERTRPEDVDLRETPIKGPAAAPIKVVEYSDFLCPYCKAIAGAFANYLPSSGDRVSIHFKHYPLDKDCNPKLVQTVHPGACTLALGAVCAQEQGKFWPYHDRVFAAPPPNASRDDVVRIAVGAGLEPTPFGACLDSPKAKQRLAADIAEAERLKVNSTPTLFVNGKRLANINLFLQAVDSESRRLGLPAPAGAGGPR
ncbi:MAG: thioredoxin domain-containing protein [Vicinamibacteria bacterium]|nr:thioredoxin domain-containing protein [Vicinamibacteria bacterium]